MKLYLIKQGLASLVAQTVQRPPSMWETGVWSLGWEDPLEKEMATHSSTLAWKILWMEEPGRLQSMGSERVGHAWATSVSFFFFFKVRNHCLWFNSSFHHPWVRMSVGGGVCTCTYTQIRTHIHTLLSSAGWPYLPLYPPTMNHPFCFSFRASVHEAPVAMSSPITIHCDCSEFWWLWCYCHHFQRCRTVALTGLGIRNWDGMPACMALRLCSAPLTLLPSESRHTYLHRALFLSAPPCPVLGVIVVINERGGYSFI